MQERHFTKKKLYKNKTYIEKNYRKEETVYRRKYMQKKQ